METELMRIEERGKEGKREREKEGKRERENEKGENETKKTVRLQGWKQN
jgi:hypothetical protein